MPIEMSCPHCEREYVLADTQRGKKVACKGCGEPFVVQGSERAAKRRDNEEDDRPRRRDDDDRDRGRDDDRPRRRRDRDDDPDDRPRRDDRDDYDVRPRRRPARRSKGGGGALLWILLGSGLGVGVIVLVVVLFVTGAFGNSRVTKENFEKLNRSMTEAEVVAILGSGSDVTAQIQKQTGNFGNVAQRFGGGTLKAVEWKSGGNTIGVIFAKGKALLYIGEFKGANGRTETLRRGPFMS